MNFNPHDLDSFGQEMHRFISELYPIHRSITGWGFRETLRRIQQRVPLTVHEVPSGTPVFDWTVPREWNISDAYVKNSRGERVIDFGESNLHIVGYSVPVRKTMSLEALRPHLHTIPEHPEWIPYRYSYYNESWGFCLGHEQYTALEDEEYEVCIDSILEDGHLTYGECYLTGESTDEVLVSCHADHPSLANDNLSGVAVATFLAEHLSRQSRAYSYRFLFVPALIGPITWLCLNEAKVPRIKHGLVLSCVGDAGRSTYKKTRRGDAAIDEAFAHVLSHSGQDYEIRDFAPYGYDERQYGSPGFNLPVGCLMRTPHDEYPEYHTSGDNLDFVQPAGLVDTFSKCLAVFDILENNRTYLSQNPKCEPQLGKRGLYRALAGQADGRKSELPLLWVLNYSDGQHTLLDIAERAGMDFETIRTAAAILEEHGLLQEAREG